MLIVSLTTSCVIVFYDLYWLLHFGQIASVCFSINFSVLTFAFNIRIKKIVSGIKFKLPTPVHID